MPLTEHSLQRVRRALQQRAFSGTQRSEERTQLEDAPLAPFPEHATPALGRADTYNTAVVAVDLTP